MPQPRERSVPCMWCRRPTWNVYAVCDNPRCQAAEKKSEERYKAQLEKK